MERKKRWHFYERAWGTWVAYVRMSATVIVAVVVRLCLDSFGIIYTGQDPADVSFWFAHCTGVRKDGHCVSTAICLFLAALFLGSLFGWACQDWITDPARNPYAKRYSFAILIDASSWLPISVVVGKTNALVEYVLDITQDDVVQGLMSSAIAAFLTLSCGVFTHYSMKYCNGVGGGGKVKEAGLIGFGKYSLLNTLFCMQWAVGWSNWVMIMSLIDALEPGKTVHSTALCVVVVSLCFIMSVCFYLRFGPEPVIPDPELQQICYKHGYASTLLRSLRSYLVLSSMVFIIMCCTDARYGLLRVVAIFFDFTVSSVFDGKALLDLGAMTTMITAVAALCSAAITGLTSVDMATSMKLSRSAYEARSALCERSRSAAELLGYEQMMKDSLDPLDPEEPFETEPKYIQMDLAHNISDASDDSSSGDALVGGVHFSRAVGASVLFYDVFAFVVCVLWGKVAIQLFGTLLGKIAEFHWFLYILCSLFYAVLVTAAMARFCWLLFPTTGEQRLQEGSARQLVQMQVVDPPESYSEPFLEEQELTQASESEAERTPKGEAAFHAPSWDDVRQSEAEDFRPAKTDFETEAEICEDDDSPAQRRSSTW